MIRGARPAVACLVLGGLLGGCGDDAGPLADTEEWMGELRAGTIDLQLSAAAGEGGEATGPVGFRMAGPFSYGADTELAVFDLEYTRLLGDDEEVLEVTSTGDEAFVTLDGTAYRVPEADLDGLRLGTGEEGGFGDLGIGGWVEDPEEAEGDPVDGEATDRITGEVDAADLLSDLSRVAGGISGDEELEPVDDDLAERLRELVRSSSIEVVTGAEDHALHSLVAIVDFGPSVPDEVRRALGAYAAARLEVRLTMEEGPADLEVDAPEGAVDL